MAAHCFVNEVRYSLNAVALCSFAVVYVLTVVVCFDFSACCFLNAVGYSINDVGYV